MNLASDPHDRRSSLPRQRSVPRTTRSSTPLPSKLPAVVTVLAEAKEEVAHLLRASRRVAGERSGRRTRSERVNHEIKRRTNVVGDFGNDAALLRLVTAVVLEQHEDWAVAERHGR
ncbi:transposase [Acidimicrobium ferrooxidans]|uniref:transposase n=1 Tax=Acidimicrobium ferrooxidans TaxID=53635 RepID=UPI00019DE2D9